MLIKNPTSSDVKKLYELELKAFKNDFYPLIFFRQAIELFPNTLYVAEKDDNLVGYCMGSTVIGHKDKGWILSIAVDDNFRREGIGSKLLERVIEELKAIGCGEIYLTVNPLNTGAKRTFEMCGFKMISIDDKYFGEGNPREIMSLKINGGK